MKQHSGDVEEFMECKEELDTHINGTADSIVINSGKNQNAPITCFEFRYNLTYVLQYYSHVLSH